MPTDSQTPEAPPLSQSEENEKSAREAFELRENVKRLAALSGVESNMRNMEAEDAAVRRDIEAGQRELFGDALKTEDGSEMRTTAARDVIFNIQRAQEAMAPQPATTATDPAAPAKASSLPTWALIGGMALSGVGGSGLTALALNYFNKPAAPIVKNIGSDRQYGIKGFVDEVK